MNRFRLGKAIVYAVVTACFLCLACALQPGFHGEFGPGETYFRAGRWLLWLSVLVLGVGLYVYRSHARSHREHLADAWLFMAIGGAMLVVQIIYIVAFGGLDPQNFSAEGYRAANGQMLYLACMPLPFLARGTWLAFSRWEKDSSARPVMRVLFVLVWAALVVLLATGGLVRFVRYDATADDIVWLSDPSGLSPM